MLKYKYVQTANGREMYFVNGKMVSKDKIPLSIQSMLEPGVELTMPTNGQDVTQDDNEPNADETVDAVEPTHRQLEERDISKSCLFCGKDATHKRYLNSTVIGLCNDDYASHTAGEIVRELNDQTEKSEEDNIN